jgi:hypothetical protein
MWHCVRRIGGALIGGAPIRRIVGRTRSSTRTSGLATYRATSRIACKRRSARPPTTLRTALSGRFQNGASVAAGGLRLSMLVPIGEYTVIHSGCPSRSTRCTRVCGVRRRIGGEAPRIVGSHRLLIAHECANLLPTTARFERFCPEVRGQALRPESGNGGEAVNRPRALLTLSPVGAHSLLHAHKSDACA